MTGIVLKAVITSVIGALASLLVERAWRRHKARKTPKPPQPDPRE